MTLVMERAGLAGQDTIEIILRPLIFEETKTSIEN